MNDIVLTGCTPEPLMNYLKAVGVFRLLVEHADHGDPDARMSWNSGIANLRTRLNRDELMEFFVSHYRPTPIIAPWNAGSGFYDGGAEPLVALEKSLSDRLARYRQTITAIKPLLRVQKPTNEDKLKLLMRCRNELSDEVGEWLDSCFVLREGAPGLFPLLGTGGNDGHLDFTNNFFQRLREVIDFSDANAPPNKSCDNLRAALFADNVVSLKKSSNGQFNPGGIGGPNGVQGRFEAGPRVNPWDYVLMIEGVLLFAGSVARRFGAMQASKAAFPFAVETVAVGYGSANSNEETSDGSRAELWLPLWNKPASYREIKHLFAEGRAQFGRRQARNSVEFALAVNLLGVDRGITSFARYGFLKRSGLSFLATPLGRIRVSANARARLLEDPALTDWLDRLRGACRDKDKTPARYQSALRGIDRAMFQFANRAETTDTAADLLAVLQALGRAEKILAASGLKFAIKKRLSPLSGLNSGWLHEANDGSAEFRLARSLAGIVGSAKHNIGSFRTYMEEVRFVPYLKWHLESSSTVWSQQSLHRNLASVFLRREFEASRAGLRGVPLQSSSCARLDDVVALLNDDIDAEKVEETLWGLIGVHASEEEAEFHPSVEPIPFEFGCLRLLVEDLFLEPRGNFPDPSFAKHRTNAEVENLFITANNIDWKVSNATATTSLAAPGTIRRLRSAQSATVSECVIEAARRLKSSGFLVLGHQNRAHSGRDLRIRSAIASERLLAAMLFPLAKRDREAIANSVLCPPLTKD